MGANNSTTQYVVQVLPRGGAPVLRAMPTLAKKFAKIRLACLKSDPDSYGSTYERDAAMSEDEWIERLRNPEARTFIVREENPASTTTDFQGLLDDSDWVGMLVLMGPKFFNPETVRVENSWTGFPPFTGDLMLKQKTWSRDYRVLRYRQGTLMVAFHFLSVGVRSDVRGQGIGLRLCETALESVKN